MNGRELRAIRHRLGMSGRQLGELLGVRQNTIARYERDELRVSEPVARLARLLDRHPELATELEPKRTAKK